jgi:hypothetical protein
VVLRTTTILDKRKQVFEETKKWAGRETRTATRSRRVAVVSDFAACYSRECCLSSPMVSH